MTEIKKLEKIEDFGAVIPCARKDMFSLQDFLQMTEEGQKRVATKSKLWPLKANYYEKLLESGVSYEAAYFQKAVRDAMPSGVDQRKWYLDQNEARKNLVSLFETVRLKVEAVKNNEDIFDTADFLVEKGFLTLDYVRGSGAKHYTVTDKVRGLKISSSLINIPTSVSKLYNAAYNKKFAFSDEQLALSNYLIKQLVSKDCSDPVKLVKSEVGYGTQKRKCLTIIHARGELYYYPKDELFDSFEEGKWFVLGSGGTVFAYNLDTKKDAEEAAYKLYQDSKKKTKAHKKRVFKYDQIDKNQIKDEVGRSLKRNATPEDYLDNLHMKGGQFGNWESAADRQLNLNCGFNSFQNMAIALGIQNADISLGGELSIAFGARGHGNALAHFEPDFNVINLTKLKGAGSLAHEWFHALDYFLNQKLKLSNKWNATDGYKIAGDTDEALISQALLKVVDAMKYRVDENGFKVKSQFFKDAQSLEKHYSKDKGGDYWATTAEMFARAGASYMADMYDALNIKDFYSVGHARSGGPERINPYGEDAKRINAAFDELFTVLIKTGVFNKRIQAEEPKAETVATNIVERGDMQHENPEDYYRKEEPVVVKYEQLNLLGRI